MDHTVKGRICTALKVLIAACMVVMLLINIAQVLCRYFIHYSFIWAEDISMYLLHWIVAFSMPMCWLLKDNIIMDVAENIFPRKVVRVFEALAEVFGVIVGVCMTLKAYHSVRVNKGYVLSVLGYDEMWKYIPYVVAGAGLTFAALYNIAEQLLGRVNRKGGQTT